MTAPLPWKAALAALLALAAAGIQAQSGCVNGRDGRMVCGPPDSSCVVDRAGAVVCSPSGGAITEDRYGEPVCGPGACARDLRGDVFCSRSARGAARIDNYGNAACTDGCVRAQASACVRPGR